MTGAQIITQTMEQFPENELIFASKLYADQLCKAVSEETYYQTLGRMCKAGSLCRIAKGTYYRPKQVNMVLFRRPKRKSLRPSQNRTKVLLSDIPCITV